MPAVKYRRAADGQIVEGYRHSFDAGDLRDLAQFLDAGLVVPVRQAGTPDAVVLRHDVDHNLEHALRFARWEAQRGIRATYYVLPTAWYWDEPETPALIRGIAALGHEIGIHQDAVAEAWRRGFREAVDGSAVPAGNCDAAAAILAEQLAAVRAMGVEVVGTSSHGTPLWSEAGIANCFLWAAGYSAADFGLEYADAYHLHRKARYISDNRGRWSSPLRRDQDRGTHLLIHWAHWPIVAVKRAAA